MTRLSGLLVLLLLSGLLLLLYGMLVLVLVLLMLCALACDIGCWWTAWATPGLGTDVLMGDTSGCNSWWGACAAGNSDLPINNLSKCAKPHRNEKTFWAACAAAAAAFWAGAGAGAADAVCPGLWHLLLVGCLGYPLAWQQMYLWATHLIATPDGGLVLLEAPTCKPKTITRKHTQTSQYKKSKKISITKKT